MSEPLRVTDRHAIPREELEFRATRGGGPGGQHVNTSSTRVELLWDVAASREFSEADKVRIAERLTSRLDAAGRVRVVASASRSQLQNRERAEARLAELVRGALAERKARRKTKPSRAAKEARLAEKKRRGEVKKGRRGEWG